jgi:hypothetical protein
MDFMNRGGQARTNNVAQGAAPAAGAGRATQHLLPASGSPDGSGQNKWFRIGFLTLLFAGTLLAIAVCLFLAFGKGDYRERGFVDKNKLQAVFINVNGTEGGQVYFGKIVDMTSQYIRLTNVFYIQNQQAQGQQGSAYNLVKLGCELHGPTDEMIVNRDQVFFWENLKDDSQVAKKVAEFKQQNPDGQKCSDNNQQQQQQSGNTQQGGTGGTAPATTTPPAATTPPATTTPPAANNRR